MSILIDSQSSRYEYSDMFDDMIDERTICMILEECGEYEPYVGFAYGASGINAIVVIKNDGDNGYSVLAITRLGIESKTSESLGDSYVLMSVLLGRYCVNGLISIETSL